METQIQEIVKVENPGDSFLQENPSLTSLSEGFISSQDVSKSSRETYSRQLKQFLSWLGETGRINALNALQRHDVIAYREYLLSLGRSSYTIDGYMTAVRKFFEWLEAEKVYPNIARGIKGTKKAKGFRKDCLTPFQIRTSLDSIDRSTLEGFEISLYSIF